MSYEILSHVGYKRCGDYVVELEIIGENNERRKDVVDTCKEYAKFRTSKAFVQKIFNLDKCVENIPVVKSDYDPNFVYKKGQVVEVKDYDKDLNEVCSEGIHYFLSFEAAEFYGDMPEDYTGEWKSWHDNGKLEYQEWWKNGEKEGVHKKWYENDQLKYQKEWKDGKKEGVHKQWYENGQPESQGEFKNGKCEGVHKRWYPDGQLEYKGDFKNGVNVSFFMYT